MISQARRVIKRCATTPRVRLHSLTPGLREAWREMRVPVPTYDDGWFMRTIGILVLWGEFEG